MKNNYTPFNPPIIPSPELQLLLDRLSRRRKRRPAQIEELLDRARSDLRTARVFLADPLRDCLENVWYWSGESARRSLRALTWLTIGCRPVQAPADGYILILALAGIDSQRFPGFPWNAPCGSEEAARERIEAAATLLQLARETLANSIASSK